MVIKMNILQNSKDYLNQSLELADIADEFGMHDEEKADKKSKIKWKLAFICVVQALELLTKKVLVDINPCLINKDIDRGIGDFQKTINLSVAINRLKVFSNYQINESNFGLVNKAIRLRNDFIHYDVQLYTEDLKTVYCRLLKIYTQIYTEFIEKDFYLNIYNSRGYGNFMFYVDNLIPFRGSEIFKEQLEDEEKTIKENQKYHYYISEGIKYPRIKYGTEVDRFPELGSDEKNCEGYNFTYCPDCLAKKGEYHGENCDIEICPKCKGQRLSCTCFDKYHY